jgi:tetratricopeptide (TPR) repeat protein
MFKTFARSGSVDRLEVFISSTIGECAPERASACRAIESLNFIPVQFEREGARAEAPRDFYLRKLQGSHIVIAIYKNSYGWVDEAKGMTISGLEDEYRETTRLGKDLLTYVLKSPVTRDDRLTAMLEEIKSGPHVIYFYDEGEDLLNRIRDDLTALVSDRVSCFQNYRPLDSSASGVVASIYQRSPFRIRRAALLESLTRANIVSRIVWLTGVAGAGKTALAAEWAEDRSAAYLNARGLDPRSVLVGVAQALDIANVREFAVPVFDDARALLISRWHLGRNWPLVIDAPDDIEPIWSVLQECLAGSGTGSLIVAARSPDQSLPGHRVEVTGFTADELGMLHSLAGFVAPNLSAGELPLSLLRANQDESLTGRFEALDSRSREILGYLALSPATLGLDDLLELASSAVLSGTELLDCIDKLSDMVVETAAGFAFVHDSYQEIIAGVVAARSQLNGLLMNRLSNRLSRTGRTWAAFTLRRGQKSANTERLANMTVQEAIFTGAMRHLVDALEYLRDSYKNNGEKGQLVSVLMSLADVRANQGRSDNAARLLQEALQVSRETGDIDAERSIEMLQASLELRRFASQSALNQIRELRHAAKLSRRFGDEARLLLDEGIALLGANEAELAVPIFREAKAIFHGVDDSYGVEIATRNLIIALATNPSCIAESDRLRAELTRGEIDSPRYRAWLCNLLVPRLRRDKQYVEAEAMAREAIDIGKTLDDQYVVAINTIVLANVLSDAGQLSEAVKTYKVAAETAHSISRRDIEARAFRLLARAENDIAETLAGDNIREHAELAELHSTRAAELFSDSFAWSEYGRAMEERGDARRKLEREVDSRLDYADAVAAYLRAEDECEAERLLRFLTRSLEDEKDTAQVIARAFGVAIDSNLRGSEIWVQALVAALDKCPRKAAPVVLGALVRKFFPGKDGNWWFDCLVRCLLFVNERRNNLARPAIGSLLLLAILGHGTHRDFSVQQLLILAGLCIHRDDNIVLRQKQGSDLVQIVRLQADARILLTINDEAKYPEATFVSLFIGAFLDAFGEDVARIFFNEKVPEGIALDVMVFAQSSEPNEMGDFVSEGLKNKPVAAARITRNTSDQLPIFIFVRNDAMVLLKAVHNRGGEIEIMLARFLDELLHASIGKSLDDEIYRSKILELLIQVLG